MLLVLAAALSLAATCDDPHKPWDTSGAELDCDEDGYTRGEGDCDDLDEEIHPGASEVCGDRADNDCDGFYDLGCDAAATRGALTGGASCDTTAGALAFAPLLLLFMRKRR